MQHSALKRFAQETRIKLLEQVGSRLEWVVSHDDEYLRAHSAEKAIIQKRLQELDKERLVEEVAYTWFNRVVALRFMDVRGYNQVRIVSPVEGESQIELLAQLKRGVRIPELDSVHQQISELLDGKKRSEQPDREAYKTALLAWCNAMGESMPYLFTKVDDWAALLLPTDLISAESFINDVQNGMSADDCANVEIIGWLYQYYISEKKNTVFEALKKNKKISPENIPAATQLFTPHWIVRYMAENSLGRLWLLNRPDSALVDAMEYYIPAEEAEDEFLRVSGPEEIRVCDPACGSGHMLTYAFDLLYAMYEEEGYTPAEIPGQILSKNLFGIEIDERAGELAAFALAMKAREQDRRFLTRGIVPQITVLKNIDPTEYSGYVELVKFLQGEGIEGDALKHDLTLFREADNFGSLLTPSLSKSEVKRTLERTHAYFSDSPSKSLEDQALYEQTERALRQAQALSKQYHVVIANPPYMGGKGMNSALSAWAKKSFPDSKSDLFAMFIERNLAMVCNKGYVAMITMQSWMFLSSFEKLRVKILDNHTIISMAHLGARAFDSIGGEVVSTTAFVLDEGHKPDYKGGFLRLVDGSNEAEKEAMLREIAQSVSLH